MLCGNVTVEVDQLWVDSLFNDRLCTDTRPYMIFTFSFDARHPRKHTFDFSDVSQPTRPSVPDVPAIQCLIAGRLDKRVDSDKVQTSDESSTCRAGEFASATPSTKELSADAGKDVIYNQI